MIKEIQKNIHSIRLMVILFMFTALVTEYNKVTIEAKPLIDQSEIAFMNSSLYYQRKISYENLITNSKLKDKKITLIANDAKQIIDIPDIEFKKLINRNLGKLATDDISLEELQSLKYLQVSGGKISSIEGLQYATNLETLTLYGDQFIDISPLGKASFDKLYLLQLSNTSINDISALGEGSFENLKYLYLVDTQVMDISPLAKGNFEKLQILYLYNNPITDISALGEGNFEDLLELYLMYNQINDISALGEGNFRSLTTLNLMDNQISDISVLGKENFENLRELNLGYNQISDISTLGEGDFRNLTILNLMHNQISDISVLGKGIFGNLRELNLGYNQISDISTLGEGDFRNLATLHLGSNQINDISALSEANLPNIDSLNLLGQIVLLEPMEVVKGQSVEILNPVIDNKGQYIIPYESNGIYDYNQNKLIWDDIDQSQEGTFTFHKSIYLNSRSFLFWGDVSLPIKVVNYYREDINKDGIIDEQDLKFISQWYNVISDSPLWNLELDLNRDGIIDLFDLVLISNKIDHKQE